MSATNSEAGRVNGSVSSDDEAARLYSAGQVRELDRRATGGSAAAGHVLMRRAAAACWRELRARRPQARRIDVLCGSGNNGGDGYEIALLAQAAGCEVRVWALGEPRAGSEAARACAGWLQQGGVQPFTPGAFDGADVIVDALYGTGISRPVEGAGRAAIDAINARPPGVYVVAVDLPSGLDADTGQPQGAAVRADLTVSFIGRKLGLYTGAGPQVAGERVFDALGVSVDAAQPALGSLLDAAQLQRWLPRRARDAHKGRHGHVLLIGGDEGYAGAVLLAARAALRSGAGLVSVATREAHAGLLAAAQPEAMFRGVESARQLAPLLQRADVLAVGPGLAQQPWGRALWEAALDSGLPLVLDADALNLLAATPQRRDRWILTPHPGEAGRLLNQSTADVERDRLVASARLAESFGGVQVLKGAGSLVRGPRGLAVCPYGNPGMATGGSGDVLTGVIAAFVAQGLELETAARAGVLAHALAGDRAAAGGERGLLPGDLIEALRTVVNP